jgi:hypothetical protein
VQLATAGELAAFRDPRVKASEETVAKSLGRHMAAGKEARRSSQVNGG